MLNRKKVKRRDTDKFLMTESEHLNAAMLEDYSEFLCYISQKIITEDSLSHIFAFWNCQHIGKYKHGCLIITGPNLGIQK